ncbi:21569_t:CDS:2, partial [Gigaspora rosea]
SPLHEARSGHLTKRCTPGGKKGDCSLDEPCDSGYDCQNGLLCIKDKCKIPLS